jgi:hypothetical protein
MKSWVKSRASVAIESNKRKRRAAFTQIFQITLKNQAGQRPAAARLMRKSKRVAAPANKKPGIEILGYYIGRSLRTIRTVSNRIQQYPTASNFL